MKRGMVERADVGKVMKIKGLDTLILRVDSNAEFLLARGIAPGFQSVDMPIFTKRAGDHFAEARLLGMEASGNFPEDFRNMTIIALIKYDIAHSNSLGWKKDKELLKGVGLDT